MKKTKILFWIPTILIFLLEGVIPALTSQSQMAQEGINHLGYPLYFGTMLAVFKVLGALSLVIPMVPKRIKEWAYAGFGIDFISAFVSLWVVDGVTGMLFLPIVALGLLTLSYVNYHKLNIPQI
jgi:DoxX-like family